MDTDALIEALARDATPVSPRTLQRQIAGGLALGGGFALALLLTGLGTRPDLSGAIGELGFWGKAAFPFASGAAALLLTWQLARPDSNRLRHAWLPAGPVAMLAAVAVTELALADPFTRGALLTEPRWTCVPLILMLTATILAGLLVALRRMAPTRLIAAGAAAGLASSGFAATLYCLYCEQESPVYLLTRYGAALALGTFLGALLGPRLLRW